MKAQLCTLSTALLTSLLITACSSHIPENIRTAPDNNPSLSDVRNQATSYLSRAVRWGGIILKTENTQDTTRLTIMALPLNSSGEPMASDNGAGRFIAVVSSFLEPLVYSKDRLFTVSGRITGTETHKVGEYPYEYPVVAVDHYYLWPIPPERDPRDYPDFWWHDPWHNYYYPWCTIHHPHRH